MARLSLRDAIAEDAPSIFDLKRTAFSRYLPFVPYRAPASVVPLRESIVGAAARVLVEDGRVVGYAMASGDSERRHLGYIASLVPGGGAQLLQDFEGSARLLTLDVFESNAVALGWYDRRGYRELASSWSFVLDRARVPRGIAPVFDGGLLKEALEEEGRRGFTQIGASVGEHRVRLGLIAGDTVRIIDPGTADLRTVFSSVAAWTASDRAHILVSGSPEPPCDDLPVTACERSFRMEKTR